eukprot:365903-Chlamydomonas_euryale.AAC.6
MKYYLHTAVASLNEVLPPHCLPEHLLGACTTHVGAAELSSRDAGGGGCDARRRRCTSAWRVPLSGSLSSRRSPALRHRESVTKSGGLLNRLPDKLLVGICGTMRHHAAPCGTMRHHAAPCGTMRHHAAPCTMRHHAAQCGTMRHRASPCVTMRHHAAQ